MTSSRTLKAATALLLAAIALGFASRVHPLPADAVTQPMPAAPAPTAVRPGADTQPPPTPMVAGPVGTVVHAAVAGDSELAADAFERFAAAGLTLPVLDLHFAGDSAPCKGNAGLHSSSDGRSRVDICEMFPARRKHTLLHELAHAWAAGTDETRRAEFLALRGLTSWRDHDWKVAGTEQAAEIVAWGVRSAPCWHPLRLNDRDHDSLTAAFEVLTGTYPRCDSKTPEPAPERSAAILD